MRGMFGEQDDSRIAEVSSELMGASSGWKREMHPGAEITDGAYSSTKYTVVSMNRPEKTQTAKLRDQTFVFLR